jgi:hypothetical protein
MTASKRDLDFEREIMAEVERVSESKAERKGPAEATITHSVTFADEPSSEGIDGYGYADEPPPVTGPADYRKPRW